MAQLLSTSQAETERSRARKSHGVHYTPPDLAAFVARRAIPELAGQRGCVVLDPACGDGELLSAVAVEAAKAGLPAPHLVGIDRDEEAIAAARTRLGDVAIASSALHCEDFLAETHQADRLPAKIDLVISNPPYVRTQTLGAARAQALSRRFGLRGRVDLYHAFVAGMTAKLGDGGVLALLCSNRFLSTKGGQSLRSLLDRHYEIVELWDLGDSKLFDAAVLPAVLVARRRRDGGPEGKSSYVRVYEEEGDGEKAKGVASVLAALEGGNEGVVRVGRRSFVIERGELLKPSSEQPWRLSSPSRTRWLRAVRKRAATRFGDLGPIRVGIKTTADKVFIRASWDDLPPQMRPEDALLHPLLTHRVAVRWRARDSVDGARTVLYTHESVKGSRRPVDLAGFPRAAAYLEQHRKRLEGRAYVRNAGRAWYEIWVPQQPDDWAAPKLVWPDISEAPRFFLDESGAIVNGDCYWLSCGDVPAGQLALAMAVANSSFALRYYDLCCGNRLYAGRRRFITQYLEELPLPDATSTATADIAAMVEELRGVDVDVETKAATEARLDAAVHELFGLKESLGQT